MNVLVKWSCDWADEFNTDGFLITTQNKWDKYITALKESKRGLGSMYFGTNEGWDDMDVDEYISNCHVQNLSEEEVKVLRKFFGLGYDTISYGIFPIKDEYFPQEDE